MVAMITGIIIDAFSGMRDQESSRKQDMRDVCYICGNTRDVFERRGMNFQAHVKNEHNMWAYLHYFMYLKRKPPADRNTVEAQLMIEHGTQSIKYFPRGASLELDSSRGGGDEEEAPAEDSSSSSSSAGSVEQLTKQVEELRGQMTLVMGKLDTLVLGSAAAAASAGARAITTR